jgi:hypothetical protein
MPSPKKMPDADADKGERYGFHIMKIIGNGGAVY